MQEQGKRLLVAVALALAVMFAWQWIFPPKKEPPKQDIPAAGSAVGSGAAPMVPTTPQSGIGVAPVGSRGPEVPITLSSSYLEVTFSNHGGVIESWHLTDKRYDREKSENLAHIGKGELLPQIPDTGAFAVGFTPDSTYQVPLHAEWKGEKLSATEVKYTLSTENLELEKHFTVIPEAYLVRLTVRVKVKGTQPAKQTLAVTSFSFHDPKESGGGGQSIAARVWDSSTYRGGEHWQTGVKAVIAKPRFEQNIVWTGFEHPYLLVGMAPKPVPGTSVDKQTFAQPSGLMQTDMLFRPAVAGGETVREVVGYLGPKNYNQLENADSVAGFTTAFKETIDLGWFAFIGRPLLWLLLQFYNFVQNWGVAIMLLTLLVKGLTIPFTTKSMRSMKAIAVLAPQLKALQEKYKNDRQRLQMETMALYKQHGANPLSGCLPIFLQMPIWLALYRMLSSTGELYQQPFIPGWINDLTAADPVYVLPIVLMVTMFLQARLTPMAPSTDPAQKLQQRMMQYGLPLMFGVMSFFFPAGLTLYIFTNTILSALHSIWMNKFDKKSLELAAKLKAAQEKTAAAAKSDKAPATTATDDDEDDDEDEAPATNKPSPRPGQSRQKRKKRRR